jgi:hypothetical protein
MGERVTSGDSAPILLDGLAYGIDPLNAIFVVHAADGRLYASWVGAGAGFGAEEAAESLWIMFRSSQAFAGKLAPNARPAEREPSKMFLTLEIASRVVMVQRARAYAVACFFEPSMPLGMARLVATRITDALEPDLPLPLVLPSVATTAAATTDSIVPPTEEPISRAATSRPVSTMPAPTEPGVTFAPIDPARAVLPTLAALAAARTESEGPGIDRIVVSGSPEQALLQQQAPKGPPKTLAFPSFGAAVIRAATPPAPPVRASQAEIDRVKRILQHLEENAPDPHVAHLRVALRAGLTPLALANPDTLGPNTLVLIETAVEDILGADLSALGSSS